MTLYVNIRNSDQSTVFAGIVNREEYDNFQHLAQTSKKALDILESLLIPACTNNVINFAEDLFLPTTTKYFDYLNTIENTALKVIAFIGFLVLDLGTLVIRLVTCIPRIIYNYIECQKKHPLEVFLSTEPRAVSKPSDQLQVTFLEITGTFFTSEGGEEAVDFEMLHTSKSVNLITPRWKSERSSSSNPRARGFKASAMPKTLALRGVDDESIPLIIARFSRIENGCVVEEVS